MVANHVSNDTSARTAFGGPTVRTEHPQSHRIGETPASAAANVGAATIGKGSTPASERQTLASGVL